VTVGFAVLILVAFLALPWMSAINADGANYTGFEMLTGKSDGSKLDIALIFLVPIVGVAGLIFGTGGLFSPLDSKGISGFTAAAGLFGLFYYFNFVIVKTHGLDYTLDVARMGFWLALAGFAGMVMQRFFPRMDVSEAENTRFGKITRDQRFWGIIFVLPMVTLLLSFTVYPVGRSIQMTMYNWRGIGEATQYVGLRHFQTVLQDEWFWNAFWNTLQYAAVLVPIQLTLALMLALVLDNPRMFGRTFYKTVYFLPVVTSVAIVAIVVRLMLNSGSHMLSDMLSIQPAIYPLGDADYSMWAVIAFGTWYSFGINLVYFLAALQTVPVELYDAAKVDGANWFQRLLFVTLPGIRPVAIIILFFAVLGSMRVFEQSFVLTNGGPFFSSEVVSGYIYRFAFQGGGGPGGGSGGVANIGYASAAAFIMGLLILAITAVQALVSRYLVTSGRK